ncbi:MAG: SRPBCC family protein [Oligoflexia bacterium]|nr:SRPBCC family protein [Oligoflexia bacterium]
MFLESKEIIDRPLEEVYQLVRDNLPSIVPYLPNIEKVEVLKFEHSGDGNLTNILNQWHAKIEVPDVAMKFINKNLFSWKDSAIWKNDKHLVEYKLESCWTKDLFDAKGTNHFTAISDNKTELKISCEVILHPDKVPGVPTFLVKKVLPIIETTVEKVLGPNLMSLGRGIQAYYKNNKQ